jgi:hypothetical protein
MLRVRLCLKLRVGAQNVEFLFVPCRVRDSFLHTPVTGNELLRNISPEDEARIPQHSDCQWSPPLSEKIEEFKLA